MHDCPLTGPWENTRLLSRYLNNIPAGGDSQTNGQRRRSFSPAPATNQNEKSSAGKKEPAQPPYSPAVFINLHAGFSCLQLSSPCPPHRAHRNSGPGEDGGKELSTRIWPGRGWP